MGMDISTARTPFNQGGAGGMQFHRHPGLDPGSMTSAPLWIPDQVRDDERVGQAGPEPSPGDGI